MIRILLALVLAFPFGAVSAAAGVGVVAALDTDTARICTFRR